LRFMFDITILDENVEIHRYDFKGVKRIWSLSMAKLARLRFWN
jgi:hypothetical protein